MNKLVTGGSQGPERRLAEPQLPRAGSPARTGEAWALGQVFMGPLGGDALFPLNAG